MVSIGGGETECSFGALKSAGSVFDRCIGARLLRFVTLAGRSSSTGVSDLSLRADTAGGLLCCCTGDEESRLTMPLGCADGVVARSFVFARTRDDRKPGLVTFAKLWIPTWGAAVAVFVRLVAAFGFGAALPGS